MQENNSIKQAFPGIEIDDSVRHQALSQAHTLYGRHRQKVRVCNTILATGGFALLAISAITISPRAYAYYRIEQMNGVLADCKTVVMENYSIGKDGVARPDRKTIYSEGKWRLEDSRSIHIFRDGTNWLYSPEMKRVIKRRGSGPFSYNPTGFSIKSIMADHSRWNWASTKTSIDTEKIDGRTADVLTVEQTSFPSRTKIYADPNTHMPFRITGEGQKDGKWQLNSYSVVTFDSQVKEDVFVTKYPADVQVIDCDTLTADWSKKLENPIATMKSEHRTMVIRDFYVNERGHIFVIYTDGETAAEREKYAKSMRSQLPPADYRRPVKWSVKDSTGMIYFASEHFQPYMNTVNGQHNPWVVLKNGQVLHGAWLVPSKPFTWRPRTLTFTGNVSVDPYNDETSTTWTIKVEKPSGPLVPYWTEACHTAPKSEQAILKEEYNVHLVPEMMPVDPKTGKMIPDSNGRVEQKYRYGR